MNKRKVLLIIFFVFLESIALIIICIGVFKYIKYQKEMASAKYIGIIKKENLIQNTGSQFKYYYELKPNSVEEDNPSWLGYVAKYTINADGLNDRYNYPVAKQAGTFRIITLGDSFTFGHYVNTADNWTEKLEDLLNAQSQSCGIKKFEVINLGMRGWDIPYTVERYKRIGEKYNPDLIIWLESGTGFYRLNELEMPLINKCQNDEVANHINYLNNPQTMYSCWDNVERQMSSKFTKEQINNYLGSYLNDFFSQVDPQKVIFFTFLDLNKTDASQLKEWTKNFTGVTLSPTLPTLSTINGLLPDGHPNINGHTAIANTIFNELKKNKLSSICNATGF